MPFKIGRAAYDQLMVDLGCIKKSVVVNHQSQKQRVLSEEMWNFLKECQLQAAHGHVMNPLLFQSPSLQQDDEPERIAVGDLKLFLMTIFSITGNKRMGVSNFNTNRSNQEPLTYGWINDSK